MSVPFSNTHLRVPQGFGALLEGLTREILRDQPEDIPKYAEQYFETLLKRREESSMDPAEWAAKLEDRFYNNHAFKTAQQPRPEEDTTDVTSFIEISHESQTDDESSDEAAATTQLNISEEVNLTESTEEEEETHMMSMERRLSQEEPGTNANVESEEESDPTINKSDEVNRESNVNENKLHADQDIPQPELESTDVLSVSDAVNVDVCAQELGIGEDEEGDKQETAVVNKEIFESEEEENSEVEPVEVFPYSGLASMDVCAAELSGTERNMDRATAENETNSIEEKSLNVQSEETLVQSSVSQFETEDQADITKPEEEIENEASNEETCEVENLDSIDITRGEISYEDEVTTVATGQIMSGLQDDELEMEEAEQEVNSEGEEMESCQDASEIIKGKTDRNESNLNHSDDGEKREGVRNISSSHQPTTEEDEEKPENETGHKNEEERMSDDELHQNQDSEEETNFNDTEEDEPTEKEDIHTEDYKEMEDEEMNAGDEENLLSHITLSNVSIVPVETESEASAQHLPEDGVQEAKEEELAEEDPKILQQSDEGSEEESVSLTHRADGASAGNQEEERPPVSEKATPEPGDKGSDTQEECSRPQEEEDIMDIPLDDPEANRAAAKIQAGFRGHMTRKKMKPEDKAEGEEVSSTGDVLNGSQGDTETGGSGAVERDDTSVPEQ